MISPPKPPLRKDGKDRQLSDNCELLKGIRWTLSNIRDLLAGFTRAVTLVGQIFLLLLIVNADSMPADKDFLTPLYGHLQCVKVELRKRRLLSDRS